MRPTPVVAPLVLVAILAPAAGAQPAATPPAAAAAARVTAGAEVLVVLPQGDADDLIEESLGVRASVAVALHRMVAVVAAFDYVFGNAKESPFLEDVEFSTYSLSIGARGQLPVGRAIPFAEVLIGRYTASFDSDFGEASDSDLGYRAGAGVRVPFGGVELLATVEYAHTEIEDTDLSALELGVGAAASF
jgi:hypothetical protein